MKHDGVCIPERHFETGTGWNKQKQRRRNAIPCLPEGCYAKHRTQVGGNGRVIPGFFLHRVACRLQGGPRAWVCGRSEAVIAKCPPQCGQHSDAWRPMRCMKAVTDSLIAASGGGTASAERAAASPACFLVGESRP